MFKAIRLDVYLNRFLFFGFTRAGAGGPGVGEFVAGGANVAAGPDDFNRVIVIKRI